MTEPLIEFVTLSNSGDQRGSSFPLSGAWLDFLGRAVDCHVMTIQPGQTRGNHYHARKREILIVMHKDRWTMCWDTGSDTSAQRREITGEGSVMLKVPSGASHAIVNTGREDLHVFALCNEPYDPSAPDAFPRVVSAI